MNKRLIIAFWTVVGTALYITILATAGCVSKTDSARIFDCSGREAEVLSVTQQCLRASGFTWSYCSLEARLIYCKEIAPNASSRPDK